MNATYEAVVGDEPRNQREVLLPAGVGITRENRGPRRRGRVVPNNTDMVTWLDTSTPGWYSAIKGGRRDARRVIIFASSQQAALFKLFWT